MVSAQFITYRDRLQSCKDSRRRKNASSCSEHSDAKQPDLAGRAVVVSRTRTYGGPHIEVCPWYDPAGSQFVNLDAGKAATDRREKLLRDIFRQNLHVTGGRAIAAAVVFFLQNILIKDELNLFCGAEQGAEHSSVR